MMELYLAHGYDNRKEVRSLELRLEAETGVDLINPFYDLDRDDIRAADLGEETRYERVERLVKSAREIVVRDLKAIQNSDGVLAMVHGTNNPDGIQVGTFQEIVYARMIYNIPVYCYITNGHHNHPWLVYHADEVVTEEKDLFHLLEKIKCNAEDDSVEYTEKDHANIGIKIGKKITQSSTGAQRHDSTGKGLPMLVSPYFLEALAKHCENGVLAGYEPRNWERGLSVEATLNSAYRHLLAVQKGTVDEAHLIAAAWNLMAAIHTREMIKRGVLPEELDYVPNYKEGYTTEKNSEITEV